jgi:hypothetical protein
LRSRPAGTNIDPVDRAALVWAKIRGCFCGAVQVVGPGVCPTDAGVIACVLGEIDLVRALALAGIPSAVIARRSYPARYSRSAVTAFEWIDPWKDPNALVERLLEFGRAQPQPPVFHYDGDADLLLVSRHRAQLAGGVSLRGAGGRAR